MVKYEIVKEIANKTGITQKDTDAVLTAFQEVVRENVIKGENIKIVGFINFEKITIPAKSGVSNDAVADVANSREYINKVWNTEPDNINFNINEDEEERIDEA